MSEPTEDQLKRLAGLAGIDTSFTDAWGTTRDVPASVVRRLARALGYPAETDDQVAQSIAELEYEQWRHLLPPVFLARDGEAVCPVPLHLPSGAHEVRWTLTLEDGMNMAATIAAADLPSNGGSCVGGRTMVRRLLALCELPDGYHRLAVECGGQGAESVIIAAPATCYRPGIAPGTDRRLVGLATQLYSLGSERNWGMGDLTDLGDLAAALEGEGVDAIGVNPLHALFPGEPAKISPYSPSSRRFLNVLYIDVEAAAEFESCAEAQAMVAEPEFQARLADLRAAPSVDHVGVSACKLPVLEALYRAFREVHLAYGTERAQEFAAFKEKQGEGLASFTLHEALAEQASAGKPHIVPWMHWPVELRDPYSPAVRRFAKENAERMDFHAYLQWLANEQLAAAAQRCRAAGLRVGLYGDLALGVDGASGEAWADQGLYASGASVGAPPDAFSQMGQAWGLPPLRPEALRARAYAPFIALVRANMRYFGALRIDHALGLRRLYWIPAGSDATRGGYVSYPIDDLLAILKLESVRNRCIVVGEDLGTVPPDLRDRLGRSGVLSYRLLYFERTEDSAFRPPGTYPRHALVAVTTHDLPTLIGWWMGVDIGLRARLGLFPSGDAEPRSQRERAEDREQLVRALSQQGLLPSDFPTCPELTESERDALIDAAHLFLARTPSLLMMTGAEDLLGLTDQVNLPGTSDEHPNWRHKLPVELRELAANPRLRHLTAALRAEQRPIAPAD